MTPYQLLLLGVLIAWPLAIAALLWLMNRLEAYVARVDAHTPEEAGLEPVKGESPEREVRIVYGNQVVEGPSSSEGGKVEALAADNDRLAEA